MAGGGQQPPGARELPHAGAWESILSNEDFNAELTRVPAGSEGCDDHEDGRGTLAHVLMLTKASKAIRYFSAAVHGHRASWFLRQAAPTWRTQAILFAAANQRISAGTALMLAHDGLGANHRIDFCKLSATHRIDFQPSDVWAGSRAGFSFKMGAQGLGYYRDWNGVVYEVIARLRQTECERGRWVKKGAVYKWVKIRHRGKKTVLVCLHLACIHALYQISEQDESVAARVCESARSAVAAVLARYGIEVQDRDWTSKEVAAFLAEAMQQLNALKRDFVIADVAKSKKQKKNLGSDNPIALDSNAQPPIVAANHSSADSDKGMS